MFATRLACVALALAAAAPLAVRAEGLTVKAADLDLARPEGRKELDRRAEEVARTLCRGTYMPQDNCIPAVRAKIVARAQAEGSVTVARRGTGVTFLASAQGAPAAP